MDEYVNEYVETALALGICHYTVLYSFDKLAPMHVPSSLSDLSGMALVEYCESQETVQSS